MKKKSEVISLLSVQFRVLLLLVLLFCSGTGAVVIQTIGWVTMLPQQISETGSVKQAVENTFGGEHPCGLCKMAKKLNQTNGEAPHPTKSGEKDHGLLKPLISQQHSRIFLASPSSLLLNVSIVKIEAFYSLITEPGSPPPRG